MIRNNVQPPSVPLDLIAELCRDKRMPQEAFNQFEPKVAERGRARNSVVRVPVYNESGEQHSYFDIVPRGKGLFARSRGSSGMFFPGRLPTAGETWHLVEGCMDAAALVGMGFNAAGMPTSYLDEAYAKLFTGIDIILVPNLDTVGQDGAERSGGSLSGVAASVCVVRLPGEIARECGINVRDVLARSRGESLVREALAEAKPWTPRAVRPEARDSRPEILVTLDYGAVADQVTECLGKLGWETPWIPSEKLEQTRLYQRGGSLVHVVTEGPPTTMTGGTNTTRTGARIRPLPTSQLPLRIAGACKLLAERESPEGVKRYAIAPPRWLIDGISTLGDYGDSVRRLEGIINAPTIRPDGSVLQNPGYDDQTRFLCILGDEYPPIPENPTLEDAKRAAGELLEVVADFPFVEDADRSGWLALVLSKVGRPAITDCVPLFGVTSTSPGSGKSLLVDAAGHIAFGRPAAVKAYTANDDEMRKVITAIALDGSPAVLLDNIDRVFGVASLDAALTKTTWCDRVLGTSCTTGDLPLRAVWSATGNNLRFGADSARRILPIRLRPNVENPEERTDFVHANLLEWIRKNRPRLVVAALTILRAYFVAGCPTQPGGTWGSYEAWSALIRGAIVWAGLADPLITRITAKADDESDAIVRGLVAGLTEMDPTGKGLTGREIANALNTPGNAQRFPAMREAVAEIATSDNGRVDAKNLSYCLRKYRGRIVSGKQIGGATNRSGTMRWRIEDSANTAAGDSPGTSPACFAPENTSEKRTAGDPRDTFNLRSESKVCVA